MKLSNVARSRALWVAIVLISACSGTSHQPLSNDAAPDVAPSDASDASAPRDSGTVDSGSDSGLASGTDASSGLDAGSDADHDAGIDAAVQADASVPIDDTVAWVLSYFGPSQDLPNDSLHLAYSTDGLHWSALAGGAPVYTSSGIGTNHIRDPFILRKQDGTFVYIATDWTQSINDANYWNHPSSKIFVAESTDLVTFTNPHLLTVSNLPGPNGTEMHAWAPEAYWDPSHGAYAIVWSGNDSSWSNHAYLTYTSDFATVENVTPTVLFDPGYSIIDATIVAANGRNYVFFKDETDNSGSSLTGSGKDIQVARSSSTALAPGSFTRWSPSYITRGTNQSTRQATEGPFVIRDPSQSLYYLFADFYTAGGVFGCWSTPDLDADPSTWTRLASGQYSFPPGVRHANAVRVTQAELDALIDANTFSRIRSTYSESGNAFYVAHSYFHALIARLGEPSLSTGDNAWHIVQGLSDASDTSLVSFVPAAYPGRYLRIDSANPTRYPPCGEGSTYGWALCNVPAAQRVDLGWVDAFVESPTFRSDATFKRVPALNGNAAMVSFQWVGDPTRYLRHNNYQLLAATVDGSATQNNDASFTIE